MAIQVGRCRFVRFHLARLALGISATFRDIYCGKSSGQRELAGLWHGLLTIELSGLWPVSRRATWADRRSPCYPAGMPQESCGPSPWHGRETVPQLVYNDSRPPDPFSLHDRPCRKGHSLDVSRDGKAPAESEDQARQEYRPPDRRSEVVFYRAVRHSIMTTLPTPFLLGRRGYMATPHAAGQAPAKTGNRLLDRWQAGPARGDNL